MKSMRIGIACPYSFDTPGGVQAHVADLAEALIARGHIVSVLTPAEDDRQLPAYAVSVGRPVPLPYNGSVARLAFGPMTFARVSRWLRDGQFDVLHVHEPTAPSVSMLACLVARGPIVATFHVSSQRSRVLAAAHGAVQPLVEKITGRIVVSALARRFQVEHLDGGGVEIPNGVAVQRFAQAQPLPGWPGEGGAVGFLGRFDEPRKGFTVLRSAFTSLARSRPGLRLLVAGPGDISETMREFPADVASRVVMLGKVSNEDKARMLRSVDVYVAPNIGGESFGMILTEAMAAGAPIVASDLDAFRRVLDDGAAGTFFPVGDAVKLADQVGSLLDDPARRKQLSERARAVVRHYDWSVVAQRVLEVYATAIGTGHDAEPAPVEAGSESFAELPADVRAYDIHP